ncbi:MAG: site-specific integrase [Acidobacteria bacterium]|nr:site-specific integrase [Acidobacteriota bacterium]
MYHPMSRRRLKLQEEKRPVRPLLNEERIRILAACKLDPLFDGYETIIITALNTGMRLMELLTLKWDAADLDSRVITIVKAKGKKPWYIPMNDSVYEAITGIEKKDEYVFQIDRTGDFRSKLEYRWAKLCRLANVTNFRFHDLRATCATKLTDNKVSIRVVQTLLGHSTSQVTERYIWVDKSLEDAVSTLESRQ